MAERDGSSRGRTGRPGDRDVLAVLENGGGPAHVDDLAERLVKRDEAVIDSETYDRKHERVRIRLHHDLLPRLADAGSIDYDRETNTVELRRDPAAEIDWFDSDLFDQIQAESDGDELGVIRGRRAIIEYGRELADEAEEELFCIYVSTDLLEDECLRHAADAIERGVEMYLGSRSQTVRDRTRKHLPEATIWEPQRSWLGEPTRYPTVGRLVFVDRQTVMLAILEEQDSDGGHPEETAIVGRGEDSPLVVLVRELLGPRLDHLDFQSTDFKSALPS